MAKVQRNRQEQLAAEERSAVIRSRMAELGISRTAVAYHLQRDPTTIWRWLSRGLTAQEFTDIIGAIGAARAAEGGEVDA